MSKLFTLVKRLRAWLLPRARDASPEAPSSVERVLQHREHLFGSAMQLLDDEAAAQQVVLDALAQGIRSASAAELLPGRALAAASLGARTGEPPPGSLADEPSLVRWLDRLVVSLAVTRLQALAAAGVGRGQSQDGWPVVRDPDGAPADPAAGPLAGPAGLAGPGAASGTFPGAAIVASASVPAEAGGGLAFPGEQAQLQRTAHALALLSTETRVTLMLVAMQGRPIAEVAELLGCSELTCRFWLRHGMKLMRRALQRDLVEDEFVSRESRLLLSPGALNDLRRSKKAAARA